MAAKVNLRCAIGRVGLVVRVGWGRTRLVICTAVEQIWHIQDGHGQIPAVFPPRSAAVYRTPTSLVAPGRGRQLADTL